jgi:hypothetical protein
LLNDAILDAVLDDALHNAVLDDAMLDDAMLDDALAHNRVDGLLRDARLHTLLAGRWLAGLCSLRFAFLPGGGRRRRYSRGAALLARLSRACDAPRH